MILNTALCLVAPFVAPQQAPTSVDSLGGAVVSSVSAPLSANVVGGRLLEVTLNLPGQTWQERFVVGIPQNLMMPAPVLTIFHGYGEEPSDVIANTTLAQDAMSRGWLVFIPLGAHKYNFGIDYAQDNIELAFEFLSRRLTLDPDRIYGVGFSMGGGAAASYAARHLDPDKVRFAALVNHTGTTSLRATYHTSNDFNLFRSPLMFGGTPDEVPFRYLRSSTIDVDAFSGVIDAQAALTTNLRHIPTRHWHATLDINASLVEQTEALNHALFRTGSDSELTAVPSVGHTWATLDNAAVLDWLGEQTLEAPAPGSVNRTVADRDGRWHDLTIKQDAPDALTPILWSVQPQMNALYLIEMSNLGEVSLDATSAGLNAGADMRVIVQAKDASHFDIVLEGIESAPTDVVRRGASTPSWDYDQDAQTLTLHEQDGLAGWSSWLIQH